MTNIVAHVGDAQGKLPKIIMGPTGFIVYAEDFLKAYKSFETDTPFSPTKYYLICHSVELSLKSYLLLKGVTIKKVKNNFGHDLHKILRKSKEFGIDIVASISDEEKSEIEKANRWYNRKGFEYFCVQNIVESKDTLPDLDIMFNLAERLINNLMPICLASSHKP